MSNLPSTSQSQPQLSDNDSEPWQISTRLQQHRMEVIGSINPTELWPSMSARGYVELGRPDVDFLLSDKNAMDEKAEFLVQTIENKAGEAYVDFVECLEETSEHLGHGYIVALLKGTFVPDMTTWTSSLFRRELTQRMRILPDTISTDELLPYLMREFLLTRSEQEVLQNRNRTSKDKALFFLNLLVRKGATAHFLFASCLREEKEHPVHNQLFNEITAGLDRETEQDCCRFLRKRKAEYEVAPTTVKVSKSSPFQVRAQGVLVSRDYYEKIKEIRRLHYIGQWETADAIVDNCKLSPGPGLSGDTALYVGVMLRNCSGYVTRKMTDVVESIVCNAKTLLKFIDDDNRVILESRCEWMLAKQCRYNKKWKEAQEHVENALSIHMTYNVQPGEDTGLSNYCKACILQHSLTQEWCPNTAKIAKDCLKKANDHAILGDYGLYISHHQIRLAQLCLHSSQHDAGTCTDPALLKEAKQYMHSINEFDLAPRTRCLYYITKSDLCRNMKLLPEAKSYTTMAHDIAEDNGFKTELQSSEARLQALVIK